MNKTTSIFSVQTENNSAQIVEIEVDLNIGLHAFNIVGLADKALNEAKERVNSALKNSGFKPPTRENRKITINLAPAGERKTGPQYDLAIAIGYLLATRQIPTFETRGSVFLGELSLDGRLRPISMPLTATESARNSGFKNIFLPKENSQQSSFIEDIKIFPIENLKQITEAIAGRMILKEAYPDILNTTEKEVEYFSQRSMMGDSASKRGLIITAAGRHNLLMIGSPGTGKTMMAKLLPELLPPPSKEESIEITKVLEVAGLKPKRLATKRPFRNPHPTTSVAAMIGGGQNPRPGEISLAHAGVLFMDEFPEFSRFVLESLRGPMESGKLIISRAKNKIILPARFSLVAAMNPCPCGFAGDKSKNCSCSENEKRNYLKKISGPLLDRIDLFLRTERLKIKENLDYQNQQREFIKLINNIKIARDIQLERFKNRRLGLKANADMTSLEAEEFACLSEKAKKLLVKIQNTNISIRTHYKLIKTARTIADLDQNQQIREEHLAEAWSYKLEKLN